MTEHGVQDKVIIVTGAGRGIGRGMAHHLGKNGAKVVVAEWKANRLEQVLGELNELGVTTLGVECNIQVKEEIDTMVERVVGHFGRVDGLINNAQTFKPVEPLASVSQEYMDTLYQSGPLGTLWAMQAVYPHMKAQGWGRIVNFGSSGGITGAVGFGPYNASKESIRALTRTAAREWGRDGIVVNCICPVSAQHRRPPGDDDPLRQQVWDLAYKNHPMGRDGHAEDDIAPVALFLCSDASRYLTGQTLMVDGGAFLFA